VSSPAERLASLTPSQRAALEARLRERLAGGAAPPRIDRRRDRDAHELSFAQQRLWFVEQLQPAGAANHIPAAIRLEGRLSVRGLERSVGAVVARHEVLRTAYVAEGGRPAARLMPAAACAIPVLDVPPGDGEARLRAARALVAAEADRPFDLARPPLLRASLVRFSETDHLLVLVLHHIAADGWSMGVLARELSAFYAAEVAGTPATLADLPVQYADFAAWQRAHVAGARLEQQLEWWRMELRDLQPLELPADRPRPATPSLAGGRVSIDFPPGLTSALITLGQRRGVTLFMTLLAAFDVLLSRWSGRSDLAVGTPVAGRGAAEIEGLIGLFVNTLVLRADLRGNPTFESLLLRVRDTVTAALGHQDAPFERIVEALGLERSLSHAPLAPVVFALQNLPASLSLQGLHGAPFDFERSTSRFDLCLFVLEAPEGLRAAIEYRSDLFDAATMHRVLRRYVRLLQAVAADPAQRIGDLPLLDGDERRRVLVEWNDTARAYPRDQTVHALVSRAAAARPSAPAVTCGGDVMSYAALEARSDAIGFALAHLGVRPGHRVGICVDRSTDLAGGLVGILKAGAAYVALDPALPTPRLASMAADAGLSVVVTTTLLRTAVSGCGATTVCLDEPLPGAAAGVWRDRPAVSPDDLAYISYTSGSTGVPKGVEVTHRAVVRLLHAVEYVALGPGETLLQLAPLAFDASTFEVWGALTHGGTLAMYPQRVPEFDELSQVLAEAQVTTLWLTASLYNAVIDAAPEMLAGVRQLLIGGEALSVAHVRRGLQALPQTAIINGYGPTEATTFTCCHRIAATDAEGQTSVPIGRPIANTRVYLLDAALEPVPIGVPGELFAGGDGVARGYARTPRLTAERFVPDPFGGEPGARLYRTGDLVRYRDDGTIEFLGRHDGQVKVRGYRIELGEIETALTSHPSVRAAAARVWADREQRKSIAAYVVWDGGADAAGELRPFLKARLPDYMVPSAIAVIEALPRTPNGKIDRDALPAPALVPETERAFVEPGNEVEETIAEACRQLLGLERVSMTDNFFDIGGHSLLATQLASRLRQAFDTDVSVRAVFEAATLAELADGLVRTLLSE
jgi:aspartate racemase